MTITLRQQGQQAIRTKWEVCIKFALTEKDKQNYISQMNEDLANHTNYCILNNIK